MTKVYRLIMGVSYWLGVVSLIASIALRFWAGLSARFYLSPRGALLFAAGLFLCAIASYTAARLETR
jgi:hypothetical protein